ncbi:MAG: double-strand break repair helicase AddA [Hyphomicrobiaceae bacterium]
MTEPHLPPELIEELRETTRRQALAADPFVSAWVSANAGTGKTHVLTTRVLRLLVAGTPPERLLCLTYTKAAAAEMSARVFDRLSKWVTADEHHLHDALTALLEREPNPRELDRARDLFTLAIETPGGLKVQTIHAFCERLLQRFPLEANVPPGFSILDEEMTATLVREATGHVLDAANSAPSDDLGRALDTAIRYAADASFDQVVRDAMARWQWLAYASRMEIGNARGFDAAAVAYRRALGIPPADTAESVSALRAGVLKPAQLARIRDILRTGTKTDQDRARDAAAALSCLTNGQRAAALQKLFLTGDGEPRKNPMTKSLAAKHPDIAATLDSAQAAFAALTLRLNSIAVADATIALMRLACSARQRYDELKAQRAALDFDDLIAKTGHLLRSDDANWVLYKLDGGLDHILVDEAQDTSPIQWRVVEALAREFLAGAGARELDTQLPRTVFAVGDEKQSIYGFQGAAPKMFADMGRTLETMARAAKLDFAHVPLTLSFRTVAPVLQAVDRVFADPSRRAGLTSHDAAPHHAARRHGVGGLIELWDTERAEKTDPAPAWLPLEEVPQSPPAVRLAERIADTIRDWIANREQLVSEGRPIDYGDILILVRRRKPFADLMVATLKKRGIPVAGADRLRLTQQLAVLDLLALADVLLLPEDDLSLAAVLKSPLFGLDDDDLLQIAPERRGSLWSALLEAAKTNPRFATAAEQLKRWRSRADIAPPYEFLVEVLVHDGMRARLLGRLGAEAADPLDELLAMALAYDEQAPPSLQGFVDWLRASEREIKRDMEHGRGEVRVMTVHGSKGLEAPIVFLPDTCGGMNGGRPGGLLDCDHPALPHDDVTGLPFLWPVKGSSGVTAVAEARATGRDKDREEHNRLLYVALTRPRDRLYVCGFETTKGRERGCWYDAIEAGLEGLLVETTDIAGRSVRRHQAPQSAPRESGRASTRAVVAPVLPPDWARCKAPREPGVAVPLAPSRLAPLETDSEGDPMEAPRLARRADDPPAPSPSALAADNRFLRGTITHALLQHLPAISSDDRQAAATAFVRDRGASLSAATRASIVTETLAVLSHSEFAAVFGPDSRAEVPIVAELSPPGDKGETVRLNGQIDRLVANDHEVMIVDFKTNRPPPTDPAQVADTYVLQLAAYRLAVTRVFPGRRVRAALLWTDGPSLMELPSDRLDEAAKRLFLLRTANLDA